MANAEKPERDIRERRDMPLPLAYKIVLLLEWWQDVVELNMEAHKIDGTPRNLSALIVNIVCGERRPIRLAERLGVSRQAVHQMLRQLVDRNVLEILPDPDDGRATIVVPTAEFERSGQDIINVLQAVENRMAKRFGERKFAIFNSILQEDWGEPLIVSQAEIEQAKKERGRNSGQ